MDNVKNKKSWTPFLMKAGLIAVLVPVAMMAFASRYTIEIDPQSTRCLPDYSVYLVDHKDTSPARGATFMFSARGSQKLIVEAHHTIKALIPYYADGQHMLKIMDGVPGDKVTVEAESVAVNDSPVRGGGLYLTGTLMKENKDFVRTVTLDNDDFWFSGRTVDSYDSRYCGTVGADQIVGRAYAIF